MPSGPDCVDGSYHLTTQPRSVTPEVAVDYCAQATDAAALCSLPSLMKLWTVVLVGVVLAAIATILVAALSVAAGSTPPSVERLTVRVRTDPVDPEAAFDFLVAGQPATIGTTGQTFELTAGEPATIELDGIPTGYRLDAIGCAEVSGAEPSPYTRDLSAAMVTVGVDAGQPVVCEFRLVRPFASATITIASDRPEEEHSFAVGLDGDTITAIDGVPTRIRGQAGAEHTVTLADPGPGYALVDITCRLLELEGEPDYTTDLESATLTLALAAGDTVACTFGLETRRATVIGRVVTEPPFTEGKVDIDMGGVTKALGHGEFATDRDAIPGRYHIVMFPNSDFLLRDVHCVDAVGQAVAFISGDEPGAITLAPEVDTETTCTFTIAPNIATVTATIDAGDEPVETEFTLELNGVPKTLLAGDVATDPAARADLYRIALVPEPDFRLLDIECLDSSRPPDDQRINADITPENQSIAFAPGIGHHVDCTFVLERRIATVTATIDAGDEPVETEFTLELNGVPKTLLAGDVATDPAARADLYRIALVPEPDFRLLDIECLDPSRPPDDQRINADITPENQSIAFAPGIGHHVDCTFVLERTSSSTEGPSDIGSGAAIAAPRAGRWRAVNEATTLRCGGVTLRLPKTQRSRGRIQVKQGGRRLIATGITDDGKARIVFGYDSAHPGTWTGKVTVRQQGVKLTLDYTAELTNERRIEGTMKASFKAAGRTCKLARGFTLTYAGK